MDQDKMLSNHQKFPFTFGSRVAVVTGGTGNIGLAIVKTLLEVGLRVAVIGQRKEAIAKASGELVRYQDSFRLWECDLTKNEKINETLNSINDYFGSIDIIVNSVGVLESQEIGKLSEQEWDKVLDTNLKSTFFVCQTAVPYLMNGSYPRIINISSNAGRMGGFASGAAYAASKAGIIGMTYSLARKLATHGITANVVAPGSIESSMIKSFNQEAREELIKHFPLERYGTPEEVASAVAYFASKESSFTTGATLDVNGGSFMG